MSAVQPDFEAEGRFWDPAHPERQVRGRLNWGPARPTLALEEPLRLPSSKADPLERVVQSGRDQAEVIAGRSMLGEPLCLTECFVYQMKGAAVHHPQLWAVGQALIGLDEPPAGVQGIELRLPDMRDFYGEPLPSVDSAAKGPREEVTLRWLSSPRCAVELKGLRVVFEDDWSVTGVPSDLRLQATPRMRLLAGQSVSPDDLQPTIGQLLTLISVCRGATLEIGEERLLLDDDRQVRRLQRLRLAAGTSSDRRVWLGLGNLTPIDERIPRWLGFCDRNPNGVAMVAEYLRGGQTVPTVDRLLYLVRFVEEYYGFLVESGAITKPKDELKKRIQQLVTIHAAVLGKALGANPGNFGRRVADTRNYHTHFDKAKARNAATGQDLAVLIDRMWVLVRACLLGELGFDANQAADLLALDGHVGWLSTQK